MDCKKFTKKVYENSHQRVESSNKSDFFSAIDKKEGLHQKIKVHN